MPLDTTSLSSAIVKALGDLQSADVSGTDAKAIATKLQTAQQNFASAIASAMGTFVKSGMYTVPAGIAVSTAGTAAAQTGATTAPATVTVS